MVLDEQVQYLDNRAMLRMGEWFARRSSACRVKRDKATAELADCGVSVEVLREEWAAQIVSQTKPLPRKFALLCTS